MAKDANGNERRANVALRELLDEMIALTRRVANGVGTMSPAELAYAHERVEWLAEEIWEEATKGLR